MFFVALRLIQAYTLLGGGFAKPTQCLRENHKKKHVVVGNILLPSSWNGRFVQIPMVNKGLCDHQLVLKKNCPGYVMGRLLYSPSPLWKTINWGSINNNSEVVCDLRNYHRLCRRRVVWHRPRPDLVSSGHQRWALPETSAVEGFPNKEKWCCEVWGILAKKA